MCCYEYEKYKEYVINMFGKRRTLIFWKIVQRNYYGSLSGRSDVCLTSCYGKFRWQPGTWNDPNFKTTYDPSNPTGFHVYPPDPDTIWGLIQDLIQIYKDLKDQRGLSFSVASSRCMLPVVVRKDDIITAGYSDRVSAGRHLGFNKPLPGLESDLHPQIVVRKVKVQKNHFKRFSQISIDKVRKKDIESVNPKS